MTKQQLREAYARKRMSLPEGEYLILNRLLCDLFFANTDLSFVRVLHLFLPILKKKEPDTWLIVDRIRREFPGIQLSVPRINPRTSEIENFNFEGLHQIRENSWGIAEPRQGIPTPSEKIDLVLVPLLTFDQAGHRVGYGKGYYDRFLARCRPDCKTIGISFFPPVTAIDDIQMHDRSLNSVITPGRVYQF